MADFKLSRASLIEPGGHHMLKDPTRNCGRGASSGLCTMIISSQQSEINQIKAIMADSKNKAAGFVSTLFLHGLHGFMHVGHAAFHVVFGHQPLGHLHLLRCRRSGFSLRHRLDVRFHSVNGSRVALHLMRFMGYGNIQGSTCKSQTDSGKSKLSHVDRLRILGLLSGCCVLASRERATLANDGA